VCSASHNFFASRTWVGGAASSSPTNAVATTEAPSSVPRVVSDLLGTQVCQVAAGRRSSFFLTADRVYACGHKSGCAGVGAGKTPTVIEALGGAKAIYAGSLSSFCVLGPVQEHRLDGVLCFDESLVPAEDAPQGVTVPELVRAVETGFSSPASVNGSFLAPVKCYSTNGEDNPGIDFGRALSAMRRLQRVSAWVVL
jgi:hypothetical protein